jgi:ParB family transcriptional regulator, chromosome partitioning protein
MAPAPEAETEEEAAARHQKFQQEQKEYEQEQERMAEEQRQEEERQEQEREAERIKREKVMKARTATFERVLDNAPATFSATQLRVFLRALVNLDPYTFTDVAEHFAAANENHNKSAEEILLEVVDGLTDDKLTGFALCLVLTGSTPIPRDGEADSLTDAAAAFLPAKPQTKANKTTKTPTPIKAATKKSTAKKQIAA